jgi:hypothetical protein
VEFSTRIYGTAQQVEAALGASPVSQTINTYDVECNNLTTQSGPAFKKNDPQS